MLESKLIGTCSIIYINLMLRGERRWWCDKREYVERTHSHTHAYSLSLFLAFENEDIRHLAQSLE